MIADVIRLSRSMFWSLVLPFQITCVVLLGAVIVLTRFASTQVRSRAKTFFLYSGIASILFIPACTGIMEIVDVIRFGDFSYASYDDIPDFRSQRYLPTGATDIQMRKHYNGYFARYRLSSEDFNSYLDELWQKYGEYSAVERGEMHDDDESVDQKSFDRTFRGLGWDCPADANVYHSPSEGDGGGATYYVDTVSDLVFQRTGFW